MKPRVFPRGHFDVTYFIYIEELCLFLLNIFFVEHKPNFITRIGKKNSKDSHGNTREIKGGGGGGEGRKNKHSTPQAAQAQDVNKRYCDATYDL